MTEAMKYRGLAGICDPHHIGHEANEQNFPNRYTKKMFSNAIQQVPCATQMKALRKKPCPSKDF